MSRVIAGEYFPEDTYPVQWTFFTLIALGAAAALWLCAHRAPPFVPPPLAAPSAGIDRFLVLWMPEVSSDAPHTQRMRARYAQWLHALADNGYHPLLLSDVARRYRTGVGLPDRAVVLVFDPGYRHTFETVSPIFMRYRTPAVWIINSADLAREERRTIHGHMAHAMQRSDYWNVGFHAVRNDWTFKPRASGVMNINGLATRWAPNAGQSALNVGTDLSGLQGLHVGTAWTGADLVNRIATEWPLQSPAYLTVKPVGHYIWGVVSENPGDPREFTLHAPLESTAGSLFWLGTRGCDDFILTADIRAFFGESVFWLRSSRDKTQGIGVGFGHGLLFVDRMRDGTRTRLATAPLALADQPSSLILRVEGDRLAVSWQGHRVIECDMGAFSATEQGIVRLTVYDKVRGAALLKLRQLQITPLVKRS